MKNIIVSCILLLLLNQLLFADGTLPEGTGTEEDPYLIATLDNLLYLSTNDYLWSEGYYFSQTADIDAGDTENWNEGTGFIPIGTYIEYENPDNVPFSGIYDGTGHNINGLYINQPEDDYVGLFAYTDNSIIMNTGLSNVDITANNRAGSLVGTNTNSVVNNCYSTGDVTGIDQIGGLLGMNGDSTVYSCYSSANTLGSDYVGGLVGRNYEASINNSYSSGNVEGVDEVGGLVGMNYDADVESSYSTGNVTGIYNVGGLSGSNFWTCFTRNSFSSGSVTGTNNVGGLVGSIDTSPIYNCYSTANVNGSDNVGGLVGNSNYSGVTKSYSTGIVTGTGSNVGGLVGFDWDDAVSNSFWNTETSGQTSSDGGTGKTTAEMHDEATYTDLATIGLDETWDFVDNPFDDTEDEDIWDIDPEINNGYPYLTTLPLVGAVEEVIPNSSLLTPNLSNYPNPFNPATTITFDLNTELTENTEVHIYNIKGQKVDVLSFDSAQDDSVVWNAEKFASGVYFYKLNVKDSPIKKMVLLK